MRPICMAEEEGCAPETVHVKHMAALQLLIAAAGHHLLTADDADAVAARQVLHLVRSRSACLVYRRVRGGMHHHTGMQARHKDALSLAKRMAGKGRCAPPLWRC